MSGLVPGARLRVSCRALDRDGAAIADVPEGSVHVRGALPGETVLVDVEHVSPHVRGEGGRRAWGRVTDVLTQSAARVAAVCPAYGSCGGCVLQAWRYEQQLRWKRDLVVDALAGVLRRSGGGSAVDACVPSPRLFEYRNQAKYVVGRDSDGRVRLGAYAPRSHALVDMAGCKLVEPPLDEVARVIGELAFAREIEPYDEMTRTGNLRYVVLRASAAGQVLVTFITASRTWPGACALADELRRRCPRVAGVVQNVNPTTGNVLFGADETTLAGAASLPERLPGGHVVELASRAFFQLNRDVAFLAYGEIAAAVGDREVVVDLYAGAGCISLVVCKRARRVVAVEENPAAAAAARNAGAANVEVVTADATVAVAQIDRADVVVLNPPRAGCAAPVLAAVRRLRPARVVYLSCNPQSLARDLETLLAAGYLPNRVTPFDMLPHTVHVETLVVLDRAEAAH